MCTAGGILLLLGALIYLYALFTWYNGALGGWLATAQFFGPFVATFAIVSSIALFFMGVGMAMGKMADGKGMWKIIMVAGMSLLMVTANGPLFWMALLGFLLTFIGTKIAMM
jgi:uncharacterized membrane protein